MKKKIEIRNCISSDISYFTYFMKFRKLKTNEPVVIANWSTDSIIITLEYVGTERNCFVWHVYKGQYETVCYHFDTLHGFYCNAGTLKQEFLYWDFQQRIFCYGDDIFYLLFITAEDECPIYSKRIYVLNEQKCFQIDILDTFPLFFMQTIEQSNLQILPIVEQKIQLHILTPVDTFFGGIEKKKGDVELEVPLISKLEKNWSYVGHAFVKSDIGQDAEVVQLLNGNGNYISMPEG